MFTAIKEAIDYSDNIVIVSHRNPDADTLGSAFALYRALIKMGKRVTLYNGTKTLSGRFNFMSGYEKIQKRLPKKIGMFITVDCGDLSRLGFEWKNAPQRDVLLVNIDHHASNTQYGTYNMIKPQYSSTTEVVYQFFKHQGVEIDETMATLLYTGLLSDTRGFTTDRVDKNSFECAAELISLGAKADKIATELFMREPLATLRLKGRALSRVELHVDGRVSYVELRDEDFRETGANRLASDKIISELISLATVDVAVVIREESSGVLKGSLRSKGDCDVNKLAKKFGGGGHAKAAGFELEDIDIKEFKQTLIKEIKDGQKK